MARRSFAQLLCYASHTVTVLDCEVFFIVTHPLVISCLDYCYVLYNRLSLKSIHKVGLVQNVAAQPVLGAS